MSRLLAKQSVKAALARVAADRALIRLLLETHGQSDVFAMMQRTLSGRTVTFRQVRRVREKMLSEGAVHRRAPLPPVVEVPAIDPNAPESFESQLARIAAGAHLMPAPDFRTCGPSYTLGGVASGML